MELILTKQEAIKKIEEILPGFKIKISDKKILNTKTEKKIVINAEKEPYSPSNWKVIEHLKLKKNYNINVKNIYLYLNKKQKNNEHENGHRLKKELKTKKIAVMNANLLDYLLEHQGLIPKNWKGKLIFFWGTTYKEYETPRNYKIVRYLFWNEKKQEWDWTGRVINDKFNRNDYAICIN